MFQITSFSAINKLNNVYVVVEMIKQNSLKTAARNTQSQIVCKKM